MDAPQKARLATDATTISISNSPCSRQDATVRASAADARHLLLIYFGPHSSYAVVSCVTAAAGATSCIILHASSIGVLGTSY